MSGTVKFDTANVIWTVVIVMLVAGFGIYTYRTFIAGEDVGIGDITKPTQEPFAGNIDIKTSETDFLGGAAHTSSNAILKFYTVEPVDSDAAGVVISSTAKSIYLPEKNKGKAWVSIHNEDDGYLIAKWMESIFKQNNPEIVEVMYRDLNNDNKKEMVARLDFSDILVSSGQDPEWTFIINWIDEDVASWSDDDPADQTGLGETSGTDFTITWKLSGITAEDGAVIGKLYFVTNDTREGNDIRLEDVKLYGGHTIMGKSSWANPVAISNGDYEAYYYAPTEYTDPFEGILVYRKTDASDSLFVDLSGKLYLETNNKITVDLYMELVGGDGTTTQVNDQVLLNEA